MVVVRPEALRHDNPDDGMPFARIAAKIDAPEHAN